MTNFPNWTQTVTAGMQASTIMRLIITNYILLQSQVRNAMGAYANFDNYIKSTFTSSGNLVPEMFSHSIISNITTNQHHPIYHATNHVSTIDPIPIVTSTKPGLISTTLYKRVYAIASGATPRPITVSSYLGVGGNKYVALGFRPKYVKIFQTGSLGYVFDMPWASKYHDDRFGVKHKTLVTGSASGPHAFPNETVVKYFVTCGTLGMTVHVSANVTNVRYNYLAVG